MNINKFNYESFALDYLEGTLSLEIVEEMERFLETHPAIEAELSGMMEFMILEPDTSIVYEKKESLLKEEKVVWMSLKWVRPLMAAASILLLLTTFYFGYQAGVKQGEVVVVDSGSGSSSSSSSSSSSDVVELVSPIVEVPKLERVVVEKAAKAVEKVIKRTPKSKQILPVINQVESSIVKAEVIEEVIEQKEATPLQFIDSESIVKVEQKATDKIIIKNTIYNITLLDTKIGVLSSNTVEVSSLEKALQTNLLIDEKVLANYQKRKRSFKDLLGKFPVSNLKEALIPSYYREETAGQ